MANKGIISVIFLVIIGFGIIIIFPIPLLSNKISSYGTIKKSLTHTYEPRSASPIEKLYITADVGDIKIQYTTLPVNEHVKIDVNIDLSGANLTGKNYSYFFNDNWHTTNSTAHLTLELLSESWFDDSLWAEKNLIIQVILRADVVFDIITNLGEGNYEISVPWAVATGDLLTNVSSGNISYDFKYGCTIKGRLVGNVNKGDILYNFEHCTIENNISGTINEGNLELHTDDAIYTQNSVWDFNITSGKYDCYIYQDKDLGANITGIVRITNGDVFFLYQDNSPDIGAILEIPYGNGFINKERFPICIWGWPSILCEQVQGFNYTWIHQDIYEGILNFTSDDLFANIAKYYYNITFEIQEGYFDMILTSIP